LKPLENGRHIPRYSQHGRRYHASQPMLAATCKVAQASALAIY
jgi:hypothetical protein